jgi:phosphoribosylformimino-5-aminoimidazole carboxamide ribotide isomerase
MDLYARVNILDGRAVRLPRGDVREAIALDADPVHRAQSWIDQGADFIHVVDLDAAAFGDYKNRPLIDRIVRSLEAPVQVAGGIRSPGEAARLLERGAWRIVMGTAAIENQNMVWELCRQYPGKVAVAVDVHPDEEVMTRGWTRNSGRYLEEVLIEMAAAGAAAILVAEAGRDALVEPPDLRILTEALAAVEEPVIAAGGVRDLYDLARLTRLEAGGRRLAGVVVGREVTHGRFTIEEAKRVLAGGGLEQRAPARVVEMRASVPVGDLERAAAFYEHTLGLRRLASPESGSAAFQARDGAIFELVGGSDSHPVTLTLVVEDVPAWRDYMRACGVPAVVDLGDEARGTPGFAVADPDGNQIWFAARG